MDCDCRFTDLRGTCYACGEQHEAPVVEPEPDLDEIQTHYDNPPIPVRDYDWSAWIKGEEDEGMIVGRGPTEAAAIADLKTSIEEVA